MRNNALYLLPAYDVNPETLINLDTLVMIQNTQGGNNSTLHFTGGHIPLTVLRAQADRLRTQWEAHLAGTAPETAAHGGSGR